MSCAYSSFSDHGRERIFFVGHIFGNATYYGLGNYHQNFFFFLPFYHFNYPYSLSWFLKYPTTVATLSRRARDRIEKAYQETVDDDGYWSLERYTFMTWEKMYYCIFCPLYYLPNSRNIITRILTSKNDWFSRLHDFGFRGTTCIEQSIIGGSAHLVCNNMISWC